MSTIVAGISFFFILASLLRGMLRIPYLEFAMVKGLLNLGKPEMTCKRLFENG